MPSARLTTEVLDRVRRLAEIAVGRGQTMAQMAVAWLLADTRITSVIVGASSVSQLADNLRAVDNINFTDEELVRIDDIIGVDSFFS